MNHKVSLIVAFAAVFGCGHVVNSQTTAPTTLPQKGEVAENTPLEGRWLVQQSSGAVHTGDVFAGMVGQTIAIRDGIMELRTVGRDETRHISLGKLGAISTIDIERKLVSKEWGRIGIYKIEGKSMILVVVPPQEPRPTNFDIPPRLGERVVLTKVD